MTTSDGITSGAYVPRTGDLVTVRRYVQSDAGRELQSEVTGVIVELYPEADGWYMWLAGRPERIFTGDQFLGAGGEDSEPATLVTVLTEGVPVMGEAAYFRQVTPDLAVGLDSSQCIVFKVTDGPNLLRIVTVTNVADVKGALDEALAVQAAVMAAADQRRIDGPDEKRRSEGRLTKAEAVNWLRDERGWSGIPNSAVRAVGDLSRGEDSKGARAAAEEGMTFDGTYWRVPAQGRETAAGGSCPLCEAPLNRDRSCSRSCAGVGDG